MGVYPIRNNASLLPPGQKPLWGGAWAGGCSRVEGTLQIDSDGA